jgi:TP901 family phage tail tape measure protein
MAQSVGAVALDIVMGKNTVSGVAKQAIQDVQKAFNDGSATISSKVSAVGSACTQIGASLTPVSMAAQGVIKSTADAAMSFETAMAQVKTIAGDAEVSYKGSMMNMSDAILQLSKDTGIAAEDVALATYGAISAGVETSKSVEFVATANALAVGGFTDMATSVDVLTTTMNAYGEKAGTAEDISNRLITTQNLGKTTVNELASSMGKVIPSASAYNVSVDNLCSAYVAMTKGGIATAESTTYMKSMFTELGKSGSTVGKILQEETGKSFGQLMAEGNSLADVIDILGNTVDGDKEKFAQLWGSAEAGTGALAILNGGTADFNNTMKEMQNSTGAASDAMNMMNDTSAHQLQVAMNNMKNAAIELGGAFSPVMTGIASAVGTVASAFSNLPQPVQTVIAVILGVVAVAAPLLIAIGGVISAVGTISGVMGGFVGLLSGTVMPAISGFFAFLLANPIVLVITAIVAAGALLIANWDKVKEVAGNLKEGIVNAWNGIKEKTSEAWENVKQKTSEAWDNVKQKTSESWNNVKQKTSETWNNVKTTVSEKANNIKTTVSEKWNNLKTNTSTAWNNVKTNTTTAWNNVKTTITNATNNAKTNAINTFANMKSGISGKVDLIKSTVKGGFDNAVSHIKGLASQAFSWGSDMIMGIVNGIKSCIGKVSSAVSNVASTIKSYLHFSVPDVGPLTDYETWMPDFIDGMVKGIDNNKYKLVDAVQGMASDMRIGVPALSAPALKNVGTYNQPAQTSTESNNNLIGLLTQLVDSMQGNSGDITIPIYLGNDLIDERIVSADDRRTLRSGGRA